MDSKDAPQSSGILGRGALLIFGTMAAVGIISAAIHGCQNESQPVSRSSDPLAQASSKTTASKPSAAAQTPAAKPEPNYAQWRAASRQQKQLAPNSIKPQTKKTGAFIPARF